MTPYVFDLERSARGLRINRFLHSFAGAAVRKQFADDPEAAMLAAGLDDGERDMIRRRDWRALMQYGAIFFVLEKLAAVTGVSNLHVYAAMRGQSLEDFQKTRNAQVVYGTGGTETQAKVEASGS